MPTPQGRSPSSSAVSARSGSTSEPAHERQRQEGQAAAVGHRGGEGRAVADPRHRSLGDRVADAVGLRPHPDPVAAGRARRRRPGAMPMARRTAVDDPARGLKRSASPARGRPSWPTGTRSAPRSGPSSPATVEAGSSAARVATARSGRV